RSSARSASPAGPARPSSRAPSSDAISSALRSARRKMSCRRLPRVCREPAGLSRGAARRLARMLVTIAMIAYDEAPNLRPVVAEALAALDAAGGDGEILLGDDGSTEGTSDIADAIASNEQLVRVAHHVRKLGFSG